MKDFKIDSKARIDSGFSTPDHYFDNFSERLMAKLPVHEPKVISFYAKHRNWIYSAAAILVISFTIPVMNLSQTNTDVALTTEVENYITNYSTITDDDVVNLLDEEDISALKADNAIDITSDDIMTENAQFEEYILN